MAFPADQFTTNLDIYRPFSASTPLYTDIECRMTTDFPCGRGSGFVVLWTHYVDVDPDVDILDGCSRGADTDGVFYADGDKVVSPAGGSTPVYVVVWVEVRNQGTSDEFKRAYLLRDTA